MNNWFHDEFPFEWRKNTKFGIKISINSRVHAFINSKSEAMLKCSKQRGTIMAILNPFLRHEACAFSFQANIR